MLVFIKFRLSFTHRYSIYIVDFSSSILKFTFINLLFLLLFIITSVSIFYFKNIKIICLPIIFFYKILGFK